jgi:hypothetical protein
MDSAVGDQPTLKHVRAAAESHQILRKRHVQDRGGALIAVIAAAPQYQRNASRPRPCAADGSATGRP